MLRPRSLQLTAVALTCAAAAAGWWFRDEEFALAVFIGGALAVVNFSLLRHSVDHQANLLLGIGRSSRFTSILGSFRLVGLLLVVWALLHSFDAIALLLGLCSVVAAIILHAVLAWILETGDPLAAKKS